MNGEMNLGLNPPLSGEIVSLLNEEFEDELFLEPRLLAVITGGSSGIGFELASQFARNGYDLVIAAQSEKIYQAAELLSFMGVQVTPVQVDLSTFGGNETLFKRVMDIGIPDALALNAGVGVGGEFTESSLRAEIQLINLNIVSTVHLTKRFAPHMVQRKKGKILIPSSIAATMPAPFEAVYGASKAFDYMFAGAIRNELKDTGVTVTALMPGPTNTDFFHRAGLDDTKVGSSEKYQNNPADVARQGYEALMNGKDHVIAGSIKTKLRGLMGKFMTDGMKAEWHRSKAEPGSGREEQQSA